MVRGRANCSALRPFERHLPKGNVVVVAFDLVQLCVELEIDAKTGQSFQKTSKPLRRRIKNAVCTFRVIEAIPERSIGSRQCPIRRLPGIRTACDTVYRALRMNSVNVWLASCEESARRGENLRPDDLEFTFPKKSNRYTIV